MLRRIININEEKCNGCGLCVTACHEGAIEMVDGKAKLIREDYCDGLGDCLPACPTGAITFEMRKAPAFDEDAVKAHLERKKLDSAKFSGCPGQLASTLSRPSLNAVSDINLNKTAAPLPCGCPGSNSKTLVRGKAESSVTSQAAEQQAPQLTSQLMQWPVQIKLVPVNAPYFNGANLLVAADCSAFAYGDFHRRFMRNKITIIGCPKLDSGDYTDKLTEIIANNEIKSLTIVRMEVPCCKGIENAAINALKASGKFIPWQLVTISCNGNIIE